MPDLEEKANKTGKGTNGFIKGNKMYHGTQGHKYKINISSTKTSAVSVLDTTAKNGWVVRFDNPHAGVPVEHININPIFSGVPDPHIPLPPGGLTAATGTAKLCKAINKFNKVAVPVSIAIDVVQTGFAVKHDYDHGTTRNTVETLASMAGGWGGGYGGAVGGAALGTMIFPGIGTILGGIIGGICGGVGGAMGAGALTEEISDAVGYNVLKTKCVNCGKRLYIRHYRGKYDYPSCPKCSKYK